MNETTSGAPLTATLGERLSGDPHVEQARKAVAEGANPHGAEEKRHAARRAGGGATARRPFPWGALVLAVLGWAFATAIGRRARSRARQMAEGATELAHRARKEMGHRARRLARH